MTGARGAAVALALLAVLGSACRPEAGDSRVAPPEVLGRAPEFRLVDQRGQPFGSEELEGRPWVADFIFTRCRVSCPPLGARMAELQRRLDDGRIEPELHLVSISVDPEHDRPEVLSEYAARFGADASHWSFLTGDRSQIWELSKIGFKLPVGDNPTDTDEPLFHSGRFVLVDRRGRIRGYYEALEPEGFASLLSSLQALADETEPTS